jgi:hypothetical protein
MCFACIIDRYLMFDIHRQSTLLCILAASLILFSSQTESQSFIEHSQRRGFYWRFFSRMIWGKQKWSNGIIWQPKHYPIAISLHKKYSHSIAADICYLLRSKVVIGASFLKWLGQVKAQRYQWSCRYYL